MKEDESAILKQIPATLDSPGRVNLVVSQYNEKAIEIMLNARLCESVDLPLTVKPAKAAVDFRGAGCKTTFEWFAVTVTAAKSEIPDYMNNRFQYRQE